MVFYYVFVSSVMLMILGIIWTRNSFLNVLVKIALILLGLWGLFSWAQLAGYVFKLGS